MHVHFRLTTWAGAGLCGPALDIWCICIALDDWIAVEGWIIRAEKYLFFTKNLGIKNGLPFPNLLAEHIRYLLFLVYVYTTEAIRLSLEVILALSSLHKMLLVKGLNKSEAMQWEHSLWQLPMMKIFEMTWAEYSTSKGGLNWWPRFVNKCAKFPRFF